MVKIKYHSPAAVAYARSMLELASESSSEEAVGAELGQIAGVLQENPSFRTFLADPSISQESRGQTVRKVFGGRVSGLILNLLGVMNAKDRLSLLGEVCDAYATLLDEKLGKVEVDVTVASRLDDAEFEQVRQLVASALKKNPTVNQRVDESIIGGLVLRVGDRMIDGSVRRQLAVMHDRLLAARKD